MKPGEIIGALAEKKEINLRQLAIKANVPYNTLYAIVKRKSERIEPATLQRIADALDIHVAALLGYLAESDVKIGDEPRAVWEVPSCWPEQTQNTNFAAVRNRLNTAFRELNQEGLEKIADYAEDLTKIPRYRCQEPAQPPAEGTIDSTEGKDTPAAQDAPEGTEEAE